MKNKGIIIFLIVLAIAIVVIIAMEFTSNRPDRRPANPFEYSVEEFKNVPKEYIKYKETRNFNIGLNEPSAITTDSSKIYITGDNKLKIIDYTGQLLQQVNLTETPRSIDVFRGKIFMAINNVIAVYDELGNPLTEWEIPGENSLFTSLSATDSAVFIADAGNRRILKYSAEGELLKEFDGKSESDEIYGFIIPSPYFDIDINSFGELWAVNPGLHALENFTLDGMLRGYWENTGMKLEGFSGCCNPAHFTFLDDGKFVTSEKGLVRIKIYKPSGEFEAVVAAPEKFKDEGEAPDVAVDPAGNVYALDFDKKIIRVFEPI
jgi:hypothetical protein